MGSGEYGGGQFEDRDDAFAEQLEHVTIPDTLEQMWGSFESAYDGAKAFLLDIEERFGAKDPALHSQAFFHAPLGQNWSLLAFAKPVDGGGRVLQAIATRESRALTDDRLHEYWEWAIREDLGLVDHRKGTCIYNTTDKPWVSNSAGAVRLARTHEGVRVVRGQGCSQLIPARVEPASVREYSSVWALQELLDFRMIANESFHEPDSLISPKDI